MSPTIRRPELLEFANELEDIAQKIPKLDRRTLLRAVEVYSRSALVSPTRQIEPGHYIGDLLVVAIFRDREHGRIARVQCGSCRHSWEMKLWRARDLYLRGKTVCRDCRRAGRP